MARVCGPETGECEAQMMDAYVETSSTPNFRMLDVVDGVSRSSHILDDGVADDGVA